MGTLWPCTGHWVCAGDICWFPGFCPLSQMGPTCPVNLWRVMGSSPALRALSPFSLTVFPSALVAWRPGPPSAGPELIHWPPRLLAHLQAQMRVCSPWLSSTPPFTTEDPASLFLRHLQRDVENAEMEHPGWPLIRQRERGRKNLHNSVSGLNRIWSLESYLSNQWE